MAYAAVTCLRSTILRILSSSHFSIVSPTRRNLEFAYEELGSFQKVLERSGGSSSSSYGSTLNAFDGQIIGVVQELEDTLEFHELTALSKCYGDLSLMHDIGFFVEKVKKMKQEYNEELGKSLPDQGEEDEDEHGHNNFEDSPMEEEEEEEEDDDDDDDDVDEEEEDEEDDDDSDYDGEEDDDEEEEEEKKEQEEEEEEEDEEQEEKEDEDGGDGDDFTLNMVGLSDQFNEIKQSLIAKQKNTYVFSIVGMAGIGKTALARSIFHDPFILKRFECRAFIRVGQNYRLKDLKQAILAQVNSHNDDLERFLDSKRYLIVLDDIWDLGFWNDYFKYRRRHKAANGSRILLTTRVEELALSLGRATYFYMPFLNKQESWDLLRQKVFPDNVCPPQLQNGGKKIADKCEGLPLMLVTIANILSESDKTPEYWNKAAHKRNSVFEDAYDRILPVLYPSYYNLPPQAKACFLYMGAFPQSYEIRRSKLVNLWCTEGFLEADDPTLPLKSFASECFDKLVYDHIVVPAGDLSSDGQYYQACSLHSVFRHLCRKELESNEFLYIVDGYADGSTESKKRKRRISIYNNVLLSIKEVRTTLHSSPTARSLLCSGAYHQYQVPINFNMRLLRVCDALTIRFYEFPCEVLELVQLRYFAITCNKNLPPSISKLWRLEYLIVHQHLSINSTLEESYLPVEIWSLQELKHLQIIGRNLPNPPFEDAVLKQLVKLLDVGTCTCTEAVLRSLPNLQKLRVQIQLAPDLVEPLSYLSNISQLDGLMSLQCVIVNPILDSEMVAIAKPSLSISSSSITKLTLCGLGYPWMYLKTLVKLPHLHVLKLLMYAFQGEKWQVEEKGFLKLKCLTIEDSDLVQWEVGEGAFPLLSHLTLKSCYILEELPKVSSLVQIELVDCNSVVEACAHKIDCYVSSSWDIERDSKNYVSKIYTTY